MKTFVWIVCAGMALGSIVPLAARSQGADHAAHQAAPAGGAVAAPGAIDGEVRKVDLVAKKLTLRHGPIPSLDMPAMTMVFQVSDPRLLEDLKVGDKVKFRADRIGGQYTVTELSADR